MKAILCSQYCGPDDLVLADLPDPVAGPNEAVISIKSAALNFFDLLMIQGKYQIKPPFPFSPAAEVAGVIESIGAGVTDLKVGDRVVASPKMKTRLPVRYVESTEREYHGSRVEHDASTAEASTPASPATSSTNSRVADTPIGMVLVEG